MINMRYKIDTKQRRVYITDGHSFLSIVHINELFTDCNEQRTSTGT